MNRFQILLSNSTCVTTPWGERTCAAAAQNGQLEVLQWAREHGCAWSEDLEDLEDPDMDCCALAAYGGHLEVLQWLRAHGCPW
jgi:hypothetical protein